MSFDNVVKMCVKTKEIDIDEAIITRNATDYYYK